MGPAEGRGDRAAGAFFHDVGSLRKDSAGGKRGPRGRGLAPGSGHAPAGIVSTPAPPANVEKEIPPLDPSADGGKATILT
jgi:hypothetical protein